MDPKAAKEIEKALEAYELNIGKSPLTFKEWKAISEGTLERAVSHEQYLRAFDAILTAHHAARDAIATALRMEMLGTLEKNATDYPAEVVENVRRWIGEEVTLEGLLAWLKRTDGGKAPAWQEVAEELSKAKRTAEWESSLNTDENGNFTSVAVQGCFLHEVWMAFAPFISAKRGGNRWLRLVALPWLEERAEAEAARIEREESAASITIRPKAETQAGNKWTPIARALEPLSGFGGPLEIRGETYANEPEMAAPAMGRALRPRGMDILPEEWLGRAGQLELALGGDFQTAAVREYMIETAAKTAALAEFPKMTLKLLGYMFAAAPMTGRMVKGTLGDLAGVMFQHGKQRKQSARDLQSVGAAFVAVKSLRLVENKPGGIKHPYDLFTLDYDLSCKPEAVVGFMINPWLQERMKGGKGGGFFLLNMSRWLAMGIQNPRLFPLALRLAAEWDRQRVRGYYKPDRLPWIDSDMLAAQCNTLPDGAAMYRTGKTDAASARVALSQARAKMEADLDDLKAAGLLGDWKKEKKAKGFKLLPVPPEDYAEAGRVINEEAERMRRSLTGDDSADRPAFEKPGAVVARQGRIYVADTAQRRIAVFDVARRRFFRFGFRPPAALALPSGLALDDSMNVYVADALLRRVFVYDPLGLHVRTIGGSGDFERPTGVAVSKDGQRIYVVDRAHNDSANHKVVAFDAGGQRLWAIGSRGDGPAQFNVPLQATVGPDGTLHVLDSGNFRVQSFDPNGRFLRSIGKVGSAPGKFSRPRGLAVDSEGKVYVSDAGFNNLQVFDEGGRLLLAIGKPSLEDGPGQYALLAGVAVDETGRIYVVDQLFNKIEVIRPLAPAEGLALRPAAEQ